MPGPNKHLYLAVAFYESNIIELQDHMEEIRLDHSIPTPPLLRGSCRSCASRPDITTVLLDVASTWPCSGVSWACRGIL